MGTCIEDYEFVAHTGSSEYLDAHNGRFCVTPEYPAGTYAYFATVDANYNSVYPYLIGPTYYGNTSLTTVTSVTETTSTYTPTAVAPVAMQDKEVTIFPNPSSDLIAVQVNDLVKEDLEIKLIDIRGAVVQTTHINKGATVAYFDLQTVYSGAYVVSISAGGNVLLARQVIVKKD